VAYAVLWRSYGPLQSGSRQTTACYRGFWAHYVVLQSATQLLVVATAATNLGNVYLATGSTSATEIYIGGQVFPDETEPGGGNCAGSPQKIQFKLPNG
jgi:hypothetical protein